MHDLLKIEESENIILSDIMPIKPFGHGTTMGHNAINKGQMNNVGLLYVLESGLMKLLSTSGALLCEKNIVLDEEQIVSMFVSPDVKDMFVLLMTAKGKVQKYTVRLERSDDLLDRTANNETSNFKKPQF